jgi:hypothetical protein
MQSPFLSPIFLTEPLGTSRQSFVPEGPKKNLQASAEGKMVSILLFSSRKRRSGLKKVKKVWTAPHLGKRIPR